MELAQADLEAKSEFAIADAVLESWQGNHQNNDNFESLRAQIQKVGAETQPGKELAQVETKNSEGENLKAKLAQTSTKIEAN